MSVNIWKDSELCRVFICRSSRATTDVTGELGCLSRFLSDVSTKRGIVACSGCHSDLPRAIDESEYYNQGVQSCLRFEHFSLPRLMHKTSYSVFGKIAFFSVLQSLLVSLGESLMEDWVIRSPELTKVSSFYMEFPLGEQGLGRDVSFVQRVYLDPIAISRL